MADHVAKLLVFLQEQSFCKFAEFDQASQGWPVLKSGEALPKLHTVSSSSLQALALLYYLVIWLA